MFHKTHKTRYGYSQPANRVEIVSARLRSAGIVGEQLSGSKRQRQVRRRRAVVPGHYADVVSESGRSRVAVYSRDELEAGMRLNTPCIVTEYSTTTLIPNDATAGVDREGNVIIEL